MTMSIHKKEKPASACMATEAGKKGSRMLHPVVGNIVLNGHDYTIDGGKDAALVGWRETAYFALLSRFNDCACMPFVSKGRNVEVEKVTHEQ
jgi:hypothetical protein